MSVGCEGMGCDRTYHDDDREKDDQVGQNNDPRPARKLILGNIGLVLESPFVERDGALSSPLVKCCRDSDASAEGRHDP